MIKHLKITSITIDREKVEIIHCTKPRKKKKEREGNPHPSQNSHTHTVIQYTNQPLSFHVCMKSFALFAADFASSPKPANGPKRQTSCIAFRSIQNSTWLPLMAFIASASLTLSRQNISASPVCTQTGVFVEKGWWRGDM